MNYKTGRLAARHPVGLRWIEHYFVGPMPTPPPWVGYPHGVDWGMLGNDKYGDCTIAAYAHMCMANAATYRQSLPSVTDAEAVSQYVQLTGGPDSGLVEADVLSYAKNKGMFGLQIAGYAPGNVHNHDVLKLIVSEFRSAYLGITIPNIALTQFQNNQPWDLTGGPADNQIDGGHAVVVVGYNAEYAYVVTWGRIQKVTWRWLARYMEELWAVLTPEDAKVNLVALQTDLGRIPKYR